MARLQECGKLLAACFPGPFDDFREAPVPTSVQHEVFNEVEAKLEAASTLDEVPQLFPLAYATEPSARVVGNVLRILNLPIDQPIASREKEMVFLQLCAHIAAATRSEPLADVVINRCLFEVRRLESEAAVTDIFAIMVEACAAHSDSEKHRRLLGVTAAKLCFAIESSEDLSNLEAIFDVLVMRDEKLTPALARARAIARTKKGRS
jgi:hypothetical protein